MQYLKKLTVVTGVTLFVSPFFTSVHAQNTSNQARTLLEVQALRQEIAELRDMVERQQYELRKLQRAQQGQGAARAPVLGQQQPSFVPAGQTNNPIGQGNAVTGQGGIDSPGGNSGVYQPGADSAAQSPQIYAGQAASAPNVGAPVDSAIITAPPIERDSDRADAAYPPVVDRSIGRTTGSATTDSSSVALDTLPPNLPSQGDIRTTGNTDLYQGRQTTPQYGQTVPGTGIISVPSGVGSVPSATTVPPLARPVEQQASAGNGAAAEGSLALNAEGSLARNAAEGSQTAIPAVIPEKDFYQQGFDLLKQSKHDEAVSVFKQQIVSYPQGDYADDAYYWIAESMYVNRKLDISKENFKAIIQNYQQSPRLPDAMLKTAYIEQEQGNVIEARILLQEIVQYHPRSNAAISAKNRLAEIK